MKIILLKDVPKVGRKFEIKDVADGFALNLLIPKGLAKPATKSEILKITSLKISAEKSKDEKINKLKLKLQQLNRPIVIETQANDKGHLFSGLHEKDLAKALLDQLGIEIENRAIKMEKPIKEIGRHKIRFEVGGGFLEVDFLISPTKQ